MRFVLYRVEKREDSQGEDRKYDSAEKQVERRGRERREFLRSLCAVGAPLIFHRSWENRIDNVSHPNAIRDPHTEGIEARNSHSFAAHRERGTKNRVRRRVVPEGSRHHGGRRAIRVYIITVIYHNGVSEEVSVSAKWMIRFTIIPSIRAKQRAA